MTNGKLVICLLLGLSALLAGVSAQDNNGTSTTAAPETTEASTLNYTIVTEPDNSTATTEAPDTNGTTTAEPPVTTDSGNSTDNTTSTPEASTSSDMTTQDSNTTTTVSPTTPPPCTPGQHFDVASFIGGIVLALGLIAIIFFGWKFYKSKANHRYSQF